MSATDPTLQRTDMDRLRDMARKRHTARQRLLFALYDSSRADILADIDHQELRIACDIEPCEWSGVVHYLIHKGWARITCIGCVAITHVGVIHVERVLMSETTPQRQLERLR